MNVRVTIALVVVAIAVGAVVYFNPFQPDPEPRDDSPWFFQLAEEDIQSIEVIHRVENGEDDQAVKTVSFVKTSPEHYLWEFVDPQGIPPDRNRWGGITLLLSGPKTRRDLTPQSIIIEDPAEYGLDDPATVVKVGLTLDRDLEFRLGHETTDGYHHYGQVIGFPQLFIIADSWGDVIARLAAEPPIPRWYIEHTPEDIVEVNVHDGPRFGDDTTTLTFDYDEDDGWTVQLRPTDEEKRPVDTERWAEVQKLLGRPAGRAGGRAIRGRQGHHALGHRRRHVVRHRDSLPGHQPGRRQLHRRRHLHDRPQGGVRGTTPTCQSPARTAPWCRGRSGTTPSAYPTTSINPILYVDALWVDTLFRPLRRHPLQQGAGPRGIAGGGRQGPVITTVGAGLDPPLARRRP